MKHKGLFIRLTAAEFIVTFLLSLSAVEAFGCCGIFIWGIVLSLTWFIVFFIANGILG